MSPRSYRLRTRQAAVDETRSRILRGARELLLSSDALSKFSMDAIARHTNVARMTVYYQFESKAGLLSALYDDLAEHGKLREHLGEAFSQTDAKKALNKFIFAFFAFFASERTAIARLRALSEIDPAFSAENRDEWRREGVRTLIGRLREQLGVPAPRKIDEAVDVVHTLASFEVYESLTGTGRSTQDAVDIVRRLAFAHLRIERHSAQ